MIRRRDGRAVWLQQLEQAEQLYQLVMASTIEAQYRRERRDTAAALAAWEDDGGAVVVRS